MLNKKSKFTLKLSREKIQLLLSNKENVYEEIGSADPNDSNITKNLQILRDQVQALSGEYPVIDVMLPDELILIQNLTIESAETPVSDLKALELLSSACALKKEEINIALGSPTSNRTQPVAAVTTKTLNETRHFLKNSGFHTNRFIASKLINGFEEVPLFTQDKAQKKSIFDIRSTTTVGSGIIVVFLVILGSMFFLNPFKSENNSYEVSTSNTPGSINEQFKGLNERNNYQISCLLYTSPSPRD